MKKKHLLAAMALSASLLFSMSVYADTYVGGTWSGTTYITTEGETVPDGFHQIKSSSSATAYTYYFENGAYVTGWQDIDGKSYYFNTNTGKMYTSQSYQRTVVIDEATGLTGIRYFLLGSDGAVITTKGWYTFNNNKYYVGDDGYLLTGWQTIDGKKYCFSMTGWMYTSNGYRVYTDGAYKYLLFDSEGQVVTGKGWTKYNDKWYYLEDDGQLKIGWYTENGKTYYLHSYGMYCDGSKSVVDTAEREGGYYLFDENGVLLTGGWILYKDEWYYANADDTIACLWQFIGGKWYYFSGYDQKMYHSDVKEMYNNTTGVWESYLFDETGAMQSGGWVLFEEKWYYAEASGLLKKGWFTEGNKTYYFNKSNCRMYQNDSYSIYNKDTDEYEYYLFGKDGSLQTGGWKFVDGSWYYPDENGLLKTGWLKDGGYWYYLSGSGRMYYGDCYDICDDDSDEEKTYYFKPNGQLVTGWYNYADAFYNVPLWIYCNADGTVYDGWLSYGGDWYYLEEGIAIQGEQLVQYIDSKGNITTSNYDNTVGKFNKVYRKYWFRLDGTMVTGWYNYNVSGLGIEYNMWIYAQPDGTLKKGWVYSGGDWYYVDGDGIMYTDVAIYTEEYPYAPSRDDFKDSEGVVDTDAYNAAYAEYREAMARYEDSVYIFDKDGKMVTGWYQSNTPYESKWYYASEDGKAYTGWVLSSGEWYYISKGEMLTNAITSDGYLVGPDGRIEKFFG